MAAEPSRRITEGVCVYLLEVGRPPTAARSKAAALRHAKSSTNHHTQVKVLHVKLREPYMEDEQQR